MACLKLLGFCGLMLLFIYLFILKCLSLFLLFFFFYCGLSLVVTEPRATLDQTVYFYLVVVYDSLFVGSRSPVIFLCISGLLPL